MFGASRLGRKRLYRQVDTNDELPHVLILLVNFACPPNTSNVCNMIQLPEMFDGCFQPLADLKQLSHVDA